VTSIGVVFVKPGRGFEQKGSKAAKKALLPRLRRKPMPFLRVLGVLLFNTITSSLTECNEKPYGTHMRPTPAVLILQG
jgi:hypothetical protein